MKKVLVLGAGGMAGHVISLYLRQNGFDVETLSAHNKLDDRTHLIDVTDQTSLNGLLASNAYDVVINCIGILVKQSESRKDLAVYLNSYLPHFLEHHYQNTKTKVISLGTDCVFSGKNAPYNEESSYDGELFYDRSKALGEIKNTKDLTFRMSIIGPDTQESGIGLFNWFYKQTGKVSGYTKSIWDGITTIELAKAIKAAIEQDLTGLYHLVPNENISKCDLLKLLKKVFGREDIDIEPTEGIVSNKTLVNTRKDFNFSVGTYEAMLPEMREWIISHKDLYKHYEVQYEKF